MQKKIKNVFIQGAITHQFIADSIAKHQSKTSIGAHNIFLGQVRADTVEEKTVTAILYSAYEEMANPIFHKIREDIFSKYDITCMHIYHSLGQVAVGEICLFVFVSAPHRRIVFDALTEIVEAVKAQAPVFGKEIFDDQTHQWKVNQ